MRRRKPILGSLSATSALAVLVLGLSVCAHAEEKPDVAVVLSAPEGKCQACPLGHPEKARVLRKNSHLKADEKVRCVGFSELTALYSGKGGLFWVKDSKWHLVGEPGSSEPEDLTQPREGRQAKLINFPGAIFEAPSLPESSQAVRPWFAPSIDENALVREGNIGSAVKEALDTGPEIKMPFVQVAVLPNDIIRLDGIVPTAEDVAKIEALVRDVPLVQGVDNRLTVDPSVRNAARVFSSEKSCVVRRTEDGQERLVERGAFLVESDEVLCQETETLFLLQGEGLGYLQVGVGKWTTVKLKDLAASNRPLALAVANYLGLEKSLDVSDVSVYAQGGTVTLMGSASAAEIDQITARAGQVVGVERVDNHLRKR